jgi:hypothetical protein
LRRAYALRAGDRVIIGAGDVLTVSNVTLHARQPQFRGMHDRVLVDYADGVRMVYDKNELLDIEPQPEPA